MIPTREDRPRQLDCDRAADRERNKVERLIGRLEQSRRIAARYEKRTANYLAMATPALGRLWAVPASRWGSETGEIDGATGGKGTA